MHGGRGAGEIGAGEIGAGEIGEGGSRNAGTRGSKSHARGNIESPKPALLGDTGGVLPTSGGRKALSTCTKCALDGEISLRPTTR